MLLSKSGNFLQTTMHIKFIIPTLNHYDLKVGIALNLEIISVNKCYKAKLRTMSSGCNLVCLLLQYVQLSFISKTFLANQ